MSRLQPYRNRIPTHIIKLLDVSSRITLFLVGQNGPLSFVFKDRLDNKYKTSIGAEIKCSCSNTKNDHCIHSLYVLLKIFKISSQNPIMWQAAYIDSELSDIVSGKHSMKQQRQRHRQIIDFGYQEQTDQTNRNISSDYFFKRETKATKQNHKINVSRMPLNEDSVCPICQQPMAKSMCLTYCKKSCGNNYHLECLKVWINHKRNEQSKVTCPMCRENFPPSIFQQMAQQQLEFKKKQVIKNSHKYKCSGCGLSQILKNVHKCILCQKFQLCQACYIGNKHLKHPFVVYNQTGQWQGAQQRRPSELKIKQFVDNKRKQSKNKEILQKLRIAKQLSLMDTVCSAYPYVSKYISQNIDPYKKMNLEPETMEWQKCFSKRMIFLRRLPCGHFIDHECFKQNLRKGVTYCEKCGDKLVKGYEDLMRKEKERKFQEEKVQLQVENQFNPRKLQQAIEDDHQLLNDHTQSVNTQQLSSNMERTYARQQRQNFANRIIRNQPNYQFRIQSQIPNRISNERRQRSINKRVTVVPTYPSSLQHNSDSEDLFSLNALLNNQHSRNSHQVRIRSSHKRPTISSNFNKNDQAQQKYSNRIREIQSLNINSQRRLPQFSTQANKKKINLNLEVPDHNPVTLNRFLLIGNRRV